MNDDRKTARKVEEGEYRFRYDKGGIPGFLVVIYVCFLTFVLLYALNFLFPSWWSLEQHVNP
ncbi:MAG: hypothetical protein ACE5H3_05840 [Planctomycetota bacterium]